MPSAPDRRCAAEERKPDMRDTGRGRIHIYTGDGKGKTTAAIGLAVRFAGSGGNVLLGQFLKDDSSGELTAIRQLSGIDFMPSGRNFGFTSRMTAETEKEAALHYTDYFRRLTGKTSGGRYGLLILDEIIAADNHHFLPHQELLTFLAEKPFPLEIVLTGRSPAADLLALADYISEIQNIRHPYSQNTAARKGIEF